MTLEIKFDGNQAFQSEAISSVVDLFKGWDLSADVPNYRKSFVDEADALVAEALFPNSWGIDEETLLENVREIQSRTRMNRVGVSQAVIPEDMRLDYEKPGDLRDFSVEMETGTGKTYVYLRTAIELYKNYGISKFVIVVPSVAIREGVVSSLRSMRAHFEQLYPEVNYNSFVYDSKNLTRLRQFATSSHLQILVMNIQAFNTNDRIINTEGERGYKPVQFLTSVNPVVIMDEPQKLDGDKQKKAIASLNPLFRLRYSATHKETHCLVYRLSPIDAYDMRLVKQIEVLSLSAEDDGCSPYVEVVSIKSSPSGVTATVLVNMPHQSKVRKQISRNSKLSEITGTSIYKGWDVEDIKAADIGVDGYVEFGNGRTLRVSENNDTDRDWWQRAQIQAAIESHLDTELLLQQRASVGEIHPTKPLTLFFIDKVANYYPSTGKFKAWFEELFPIVLSDGKYRNLKLSKDKIDPSKLHKGYFSTTKKGEALDSQDGRETAEDKEAFRLIMRAKEELLSFDEPVRFIFSHSALQEGWDNPNVFTICNLQEGSKSEVRRRQQLGRGLRLPVMANGERCRVDEVNRLTVIASESFESFASKLQQEIESDTGESYGLGRIKNARSRRQLKLRQDQLLTVEFNELWKRISPKTHYMLEFTTDDIVSEAEYRLRSLIQNEPVSESRIRKTRDSLKMSKEAGVYKGAGSLVREFQVSRASSIPDILTELSARLPISRSTIYRVIKESETEHLIQVNPSSYMDRVFRACNHALGHTLREKDGIHYYPVGEEWEASLFLRQSIPESYEDNLVETEKSIFDAIPCDSNVEREFASALEEDDSVKMFLKLPSWFKVPTPLGNYNPDWAVAKQEGLDLFLYLVRETKGTSNPDELFRESEKWKVAFGQKHFDSLTVDYQVTSTWG